MAGHVEDMDQDMDCAFLKGLALERLYGRDRLHKRHLPPRRCSTASFNWSVLTSGMAGFRHPS